MDADCWSGRRLNPRPSAQQTHALPTDLARRTAWPEVTPPRNLSGLYATNFRAVFLTSQIKGVATLKPSTCSPEKITSKMNKRKEDRGKEKNKIKIVICSISIVLIIFTLISGRALLYVWALQCALRYNLRQCKENRMLPRNSLR